jgi:hypothetical protein
VNGVAGGNATVGTVSSSGLYTAPAAVPGSGVTVTATSVADPTRSASANVTVLAAVSVGVSPPTANVQLSQNQNFSAKVTNDPGNLGVTWSLSGGGCSGTACGTLSNATTALVTYTAPAALPSPATVTLTATSKRDGTKSNTAIITLTAPVIVVKVLPPTASVNTGGTQNFTVNVQNDSQNKGVSWSLLGGGCSGTACGTLTNVTTASLTYNAPSTAPNPATVTLTATSIADGTKSGTATITVNAFSTDITVSVSPKRGGLVTKQTLPLKATLANDTGNAGVTWSFTSTGGTSGGSISPTSSISNQSVTFTAPSSAGVVTITATSVADGSKTAVATIGVTNQAGVLTYLNGNLRQGSNAEEYALTTSGVTAVNSTNFGKLFSCTVDAPIYAQPLWVPDVSIGGQPHNLIFVATEHDSVYAFDADSNPSPCLPLWKASLIDTAHGAESTSETWVSSGDVACGDITPDIGVVGTPVIDLVSKTLYVVSKSKNSSSTAFYQRIHALDFTTGNERFGPTNITPAKVFAAGMGVGSSIPVGGNVPEVYFDPLINNQRSALLLTNGHVIVDWASHCDNGAYHGWVVSFNASSLEPEAVFSTSPNGIDSGVWMAGSGPATDAIGNIYLAVGNGTFDANNDYGDAILKLGQPSGGKFPVVSYFRSYTLHSPDTPADIDQGSGGVLLLPAVGSHKYLVQAGKDANVYVANQDSLGGYNSTSNNVVQWLYEAAGGGMWGSPTYWNGNVYFGAGNGGNQYRTDPIRAFSFDTVSTATLSTSPTSVTTEIFGFPGPTPFVSANGTTNGIVWALDNFNYCTNAAPTLCLPTVLHAYDATNLATEFWNSSQNAGDTAGNAVKFTVPTVVNGKVYVGTRGNDRGAGGTSIPGELNVYGLKPN